MSEGDELTALRAEVAQLRTERAISQVYVRYAWLMDTGQHEQATEETFTADAELSLGEAQPSFVGRESQLQRLEKVRGILEGTTHFITNVHIEILSEERASARAYVQSYNWSLETAADPAPRPVDFVGIGVYLDDLRLEPEGWRIYRRRRRSLGPSPLGHGQMPGAMREMLPAWGGDTNR